MTTTVQAAAVSDFAAAVRVALSDLPPDELDELTDGLEADLAERAADSGDPDLGDPVLYAEELRAAAGYPPQDARSHRGSVLPDLAPLRERMRRRLDELRAHPAGAAAIDFLIALRPLWWVFRGWAIGMWIGSSLFGGWAPIPESAGGWLVMLGLIVASVQLGRGRWLPRQWMRRAFLAVNIVMVIATPFILGWAGNALENMKNAYYYGSGETWYPGSLNLDGRQIDNIFAYDAEGNPIERVQLFDQDGNPLDLVANTGEPFWGTMDGRMVVPSGDVPGRPGWNVYPLQQTDWDSFDDDGVIDEDELRDSPFPSVQVKSLAGATPASGSPDPATVASPDATQPGDDQG